MRDEDNFPSKVKMLDAHHEIEIASKLLGFLMLKVMNLLMKNIKNLYCSASS
ncbi:unnamed protein product [Rhodiola kirilowii]